MNPNKVTLADIMTENPDTLSPNDLAMKALEKMQQNQYRHMPVVDGDQIIGMVSIRDLYAAVKEMLEKNELELVRMPWTFSKLHQEMLLKLWEHVLAVQ